MSRDKNISIVKMKKHIITLLTVLFSMVLCPSEIQAKKIKIVTTPETAKIYVDGNYVGDGVYLLNFTRKDDFFSVKVEAPGFVEKTIRIYKHDTRKTIPITLQEDDALEGSVASDLANKYFTINVREGVDEDLAWKLLSQVMLNYFDEIKTSDKAAGYMNTAWYIHRFPQADVKVRTRVQIKQVTGDGLAYQIRISTEIAPQNVQGEQGYKQWPRVLKKYESMINEMQSRIGQN